MLDDVPYAPTIYCGTSDMHEGSNAEWCVDFGALLEAMDTPRLYAAIDCGQVTAAMRVWREGLDGWTPVEALPELAPRAKAASEHPK